MCTYLTPPRNGTYYFRRGIPEELRAQLGKREFMFSLKVKDRAAAKRLVAIYALTTQQQLDLARAEVEAAKRAFLSTDERENLELARAQARYTAAFEEQLLLTGDEATARRAARRVFADYNRQRLSRSTAQMPPEEAARWDMLKKAIGDRDDLQWKLDAQAALGRGEELPPRPAALSSPKPRHSIAKMFDRYKAAAQLAPNTVTQFRAVITHLSAFLGHDDLAKINPASLIRWREHLLVELTPKGRPRSAKTINDSYLAAASALLKYCVGQQVISSNPMRDVEKVRADKKPKLRERDFSTTEQSAILSASLKPLAGRISVERQRAVRWVPWICAYTGARVNEITQCRAEDFALIDGVWTLHITPEAGPIKTAEARYVPLHPHLIEQGLLELVRGVKTGPLFFDPSKARVQNGRQSNVKTGQFLADWVRKTAKVTDPGVAPNHGWRHTFKTRALEAGLTERAVDYMQGHAPVGQGRRYGHTTMTALNNEMANYPRYPVDVSS